VAKTTPINHAISVGFSDINDVNDNFIGVSYKYYFENVNIAQQPWSISPYLQRVNNVSVSYYNINTLSRIQASGEWFLKNDWIVRGRLSNSEFGYSSYGDTRIIGADVGKFIDNNWEVGAGLDYIDYETFRNSDDQDINFSVYARYVSFARNQSSFQPGWDVGIKGSVVGDFNSLALNADYYFSPKWSINTSIVNQDDNWAGSETIIELGTGYWFNPHASIEFGLGVNTDETQLASATLLGTFRF
jgi:hypothetical protein